MSRSARRNMFLAGLVWLIALVTIGQPPNVQAAPLNAPAIEIHVVQAGETLNTIAAAFHVSPTRLAEVNNIGAPGTLAIGDRLVIPHDPGIVPADSGVKVTVGLGDTL